MSPDEQKAAAAVLRDAAQRLSDEAGTIRP